MGRRRARGSGGRARVKRWPRGTGASPPAPAGPPRDPGARRLDQPARARICLPPAVDPARRRVRRRQVLRAVLHDAPPADRGARLRRRRVPAGGRGGRLRGPGTRRRAGRGTRARRGGDLAAEPVPGPLRARPGGALHRRRDAAGDDRGRSRRRRRDREAPGADRRRPTPGARAHRPGSGRGAPGQRASLRPPGRPAGPADPPPGRHHQPAEPRRLRRRGRLPRAATGDRGRPRGGHRGGDGIRPSRPGRRRLPHRSQVGSRGRAAGPAPLHGLQRRRDRSPARSRTGC